MPVRVLSSPRSRSWVRRILRRFRARGTRPAGGWVTPHAAVNLLPGHGASMNMRVHGLTTPATVMRADISFSRPPGSESEARATLTTRVHASRLTAPGWFGYAMENHGLSNGVPLGRADFTNRGGGDALESQ